MSFFEPGVESARSVNMALILRAVVTQGAISRSELVLQTGLSRKTVGAVVGELARRNLVEESDTAARGVGRPSFTVRPADSVAALSVCLTLGSVRIAVVGLDGVVQERVDYRSDRSATPDELVNAIVAVAEAMGLSRSRKVIGIGLVVPEPGLGGDEAVGDAAASALGIRLGLPVVLATAGTAGARAESIFGAASGAQEMIYLRCGPDGRLAGGIVTGGAIVLGHRGRAGCFTPVAGRTASTGRAQSVEDHVLSVLDVLGPVLDPEVVVLGGSLVRSVEAVRAGVERRRSAADDTRGVGPAIIGSALGDDDLFIGAAQSVFEGVLSDPRNFDAGRLGAEDAHPIDSAPALTSV